MSLSSQDKKILLSHAIKASKMAEEIIINNKSSKDVISSTGHDIKIEGDKLSEKIIINYLQDNTDFPILSEESGMLNVKQDQKDFFWVVDPIDGSMNFNRGIPFCCTSIALVKRTNNSPVLGVINDFNHKQIFSGIDGENANCNDEIIKVSEITNASNAILCTGFPVYTDFSSKAVSSFINKVQSFKKVRLLGSAALSLTYVASGIVDAYFEENIKLWDVAAGIALIKAAGGKVFIEPTDTQFQYNVLGINNSLNPEELLGDI